MEVRRARPINVLRESWIAVSVLLVGIPVLTGMAIFFVAVFTGLLAYQLPPATAGNHIGAVGGASGDFDIRFVVELARRLDAAASTNSPPASQHRTVPKSTH